MAVILPNEVDLANVSFGEVKPMNNGGKIMYVNYSGGALNIQTPEVRLPFDVSCFKDADGKSEKYSFSCSLDNYDSSKPMKELFEKLVELDVMVKAYAKENSLQFFKKKTISDETIDELYNPIVKVSRDPETGEPNGKYAPSIKVKINKRDDKIQCKLYDSKKVPFDVNGDTDSPVNIEKLLVKDTRSKILICCTGVWIINGKFGCSWKAVQMRLDVATKDLEEYAFRDTEEDVEFVDSDNDDDSDSSDSDSEDEEEEKVEAPKKKVRKAKTSK
jgi:hypothetical protein